MGEEGWKIFEGKTVFIETKSRRQYTGKIISIKVDGPLTWINLLDKFGARITFVHSEIALIQEQGRI